MGRLTIPDVRVDEHTTRRSVIDVAAVREHAMEFYCRLKAYEDTGWTPEMLHKLGENAGHMWDFAQAAEKMTVGRLKELAEADKDGRVIVLPAKKGDTLYAVTRFGIEKRVVKEIAAPFFYNTYESIDRAALSTAIRNFGKTVFLTHEEAEKALREIQGKEDADGATDKPE